MSANDVLSTVRTVCGYIGTALIIIAAVKFAGVANIQVRGEYWQIALMGMALRQA